LCPIISYQLRKALFLTKSSRWPPDLISQCPLGPGKKPRYTIIYIYTIYYLLYTISFLSKGPANEPPPGSAEPLRRELLIYVAFFISLKKTGIKIPLMRRPQGRNAHPFSPSKKPP